MARPGRGGGAQEAELEVRRKGVARVTAADEIEAPLAGAAESR